MKYLTGIHALNINCPLDTCGDWHQSALKWENLTIKESEGSILGEFGIFKSDGVPDGKGGWLTMNAADTIRACFDLILDKKENIAQGMREDFIGNEAYTETVFQTAEKFRNTKYWRRVSAFIEKEYELDWLAYKERRHL